MELFGKLWDVAHQYAGINATRHQPTRVARAAIPYLNEPWYC
jgi:hypothetical protein